MNEDIKCKYMNYRETHPWMRAMDVLKWVKRPNAKERWEQVTPGGHIRAGADPVWQREIDGLTVTIEVESDSIFPEPDKHGNTNYGSYAGNTGYNSWREDDYDWRGQWCRPDEMPPLGLPYTCIHYEGPGWMQGEEGGYFIPDGIEEMYESYRERGQSKSVAWDLTKLFVEEQLEMLFHSPLTNCIVIVKVYSEGIELASTAMGTDVSGDEEGHAYIFEMVEEYGMADEVIEDAKKEIKRLAALEVQ